MKESSEERLATRAALRPLWAQCYVPNLILSTGQGALLPVLAIAASNEGASTPIAGVIVAVNAFGTLVFDIPSGWIVTRFGEILSTWIAATLLVVGIAGAIFTRHSPLLLGVAVFVAASGWAVWNLVRLTHLSRVAIPAVRGRALSIFGGMARAGQVIGPFIVAAFSIGKPRNAHVAFLIDLIAIVVGFALIARVRDKNDVAAAATSVQRMHLGRVIKDNRHEFVTAGPGSFGISLLRGSRQAVIPLWGLHIGLGLGAVSLIYGISSVMDLSLFYPSGIASDRYGRKAVAIPCLVLLSVGHIVLPLSHAFSTLLLASLLISFGNGMGSGLIMTLGADRAPDIGRATFLAIWRSVSDGGTTAGPLIVSGVTAVSTLALGPPAVGVIGLGCAFVVFRWMQDPFSRRQGLRDKARQKP